LAGGKQTWVSQEGEKKKDCGGKTGGVPQPDIKWRVVWKGEK